MSFQDIREQDLGFRPQHENNYSTLFRVVPGFDSTSVNYFKKIKKYLQLSIANDDTERAAAWMMNLSSYVEIYGLKFSRSDHIELVKVCYDLMCVPGLDVGLLNQTAACLDSLLRKKKTLSPDDLNLDWKPLYDLINYYYAQDESNERMRNIVFRNHLQHAVTKVKTYFNESASREIFRLEAPNLCPFSSPKLKQALFILSSLLPMEFASGKESSMFIHWFEPLMTLWQSMPSQLDVESDIMEIFSTFSYNYPGVIDWSPYMPFIYSRIIATTCGKDKTPRIIREGKLQMNSCAKWIVSTLGGQQMGQKYLDKFMTEFRTCKKYDRRFSSPLEVLLENIIKEFWERISREASHKILWKSPVPQEFRIKDDDIDAFFNSIFSNFVDSINLIHLLKEPAVVAKFTALRPAIVIPKYLASFDEAFSDVCFPDKYMAILEMMAAIVQACVFASKSNAFPEGVELLVPLLSKILSYEPMNDLPIVLNSCRVVFLFFSLVPVVDTSASNINSEFSERESIVNSNSSLYEEIALRTLDIVFSRAKSLQFIQTRLDSESKNLNTMEHVQSALITENLSKLLMNVSPQIFKAMFEKYKKFVFEDIREANISAVVIGKIGRAFTKADPEKTLGLIVPDLVDAVVSCVDSDGNLVEDRSESDLLYYLTILVDVICCDSPKIEPWIPLITTVFPTVLLKCTLWDCVRLSASCLGSCFSTLSSIGVEHESVVQFYDNPNLCPLEDWGMKRRVKDLKFKFLLPGSESKSCIEDLISSFIWPQVEYLESFCEQDDKSRDQVKRALLIIKSISPILDVTPRWQEDPLFGPLDQNEPSESVLYPLVPLDVTFPGNRNVQKTVVDVLIKTADKILAVDEHSVKALMTISEILARIVGLKMEMSKQFWAAEWTWLEGNSVATDRRHPLAYHARMLKQFMTQLHPTGHEFLTETHRAFVLCLMKLAVSDYVSVRLVSCMTLAFMESNHSYFGVHKIIYPQIKANLMTNPLMDSSVYEGTMNLITQCCKDLSHPKVLEADFLPLLFKPNKLIETVVGTVYTRFNAKIKMNNRCFPKLNCWLSNKQSENPFKTCYHSTLDSLLSLNFQSFDGSPLPWNFEVIHLMLLNLLDYSDQTLPVRAFKFVLEKLFSDLYPIHKVAVEVGYSIIRSLKKKHTPNVCVETSKIIDLNESWKFGEDELTDRIQYRAESRPVYSGGILYVHSNHVGYTSWPSELKVCTKWELEEDYPGAVLSVFTAERTKKLMSIACMRGTPSYCRSNTGLYEGIFTLCPPVVELFLVELDELFDTNPDEILLCACVEVLCGILRSMKHWPDSMRINYWPRILSMFDRGIKWKVQNSSIYWGHCFNFGLKKSDPDMMHNLFELLVDWTFDDSSFAADLSKKIYYLSTAIFTFSWRMASFNWLLLKKISPYIDHKSQIIRNEIAKLLVAIFDADRQFKGNRTTRSPRVKDFIDDLVLPSVRIIVNSELSDAGDSEDLKKAKRIMTTVCRWLNCLFKARSPTSPEIYKLVPILCLTSSQDELDWEELKLLSSEALKTLARQTVTSFDFHIVFPELISCYQYFKDFRIKGKTRVEYFNFMQIFIFFSRPQILFSNDYVNDVNKGFPGINIKTITLSALKDENIEVRLAGKKMLADLIHFKIVTDVDSLIESFIHDCKKKVIDSDPKTHVTHQAAVLGLLAFLTANPDDVPEYLPRVFKMLSRYSNDSHPVGQWIGKEVSDFMLRHKNSRKKVEEIISREILDDFGGANLSYFS